MTLQVLAPTWLEALALRRELPVRVTGMGRARSVRAAAALTQQALGNAPIVVAGVAGGVAAELRTGDVVVADRVLADGLVVPCSGTAGLAAALRAAGLTVRVGPVWSANHVVGDRERRRLAGSGALAVDMESAWLLAAHRGPHAVVRVVADHAGTPLLRPATLGRLWRALATLRRVGPVLAGRSCTHRFASTQEVTAP